MSYDTALIEVGPESGSQLVAQDLLSYTVNLQFAVQQGTAISADQLSALLLQDAEAYCKSFPERCPGGVPTADIASAVEAYRTQLGTTAQATVSEIQNNAIALPLAPTFYSTSPITSPYYNPSAGFVAAPNSVAVEKSPTIPAFTTPANVLATSPGQPSASGGGTDLAGTGSGTGPSQGGSTTQQTNLNPMAQQANALMGGKNLWLILGVLLVLVLLFGRGE